MPTALHHFSTLAIAGLSPMQNRLVLAHARALQQAVGSGQVRLPLRGKNLGLLCEAGNDADAALLRRAATELGAHVAHLRPSLSKLSTPEDIQHTAHLLGRLYDALACQGQSPALIQQLGNDAGVPIYDGIASAGHPTALLAEQLDGDDTPDDKRRFVLQALLLATMT